jgi:hypothetical protein
VSVAVFGLLTEEPAVMGGDIQVAKNRPLFAKGPRPLDAVDKTESVAVLGGDIVSGLADADLKPDFTSSLALLCGGVDREEDEKDATQNDRTR